MKIDLKSALLIPRAAGLTGSAAAASTGPHRGQSTSTFGLYLVQLTQLPKLRELNDLKTATSAV